MVRFSECIDLVLFKIVNGPAL